MSQQALEVLWAGEVAALVAVPDLGSGLQQGFIHSLQDKVHFQSLAQTPADDEP
jgi:hypothetical protein